MNKLIEETISDLLWRFYWEDFEDYVSAKRELENLIDHILLAAKEEFTELLKNSLEEKK